MPTWLWIRLLCDLDLPAVAVRKQRQTLADEVGPRVAVEDLRSVNGSVRLVELELIRARARPDLVEEGVTESHERGSERPLDAELVERAKKSHRPLPGLNSTPRELAGPAVIRAIASATSFRSGKAEHLLDLPELRHEPADVVVRKRDRVIRLHKDGQRVGVSAHASSLRP